MMKDYYGQNILFDLKFFQMKKLTILLTNI
jgi:hypothetical protein